MVLLLTVLYRDYSSPDYGPRLRTVSIRGNIPRLDTDTFIREPCTKKRGKGYHWAATGLGFKFYGGNERELGLVILFEQQVKLKHLLKVPPAGSPRLLLKANANEPSRLTGIQ